VPVTAARDALSPAQGQPSVGFRPRILVIDDNKQYGELIERALLDQSIASSQIQFDVEVITDASSALQHLDRDSVDIYCVDLRLKDSIPFQSDEAAIQEGLDLISEIRAKAPTAGIIVITSVGEDRGAIKTWNMGAHVYIRKPAAPGIYRANALTLWEHIRERRSHRRSFRIGEWVFLLGSRTVKSAVGEVKRLSAKEYLLLRHLVTAENNQIDRATFAMYFSRETISEKERSVDSVKKRLIKKLGDSVEIIQVRDEGYKLISVQEI
jgi:DNA-binding response OmpR family regulator